MEWTVHLARKMAFADINIQAGFAGESVLVHLESGAPSRIGCAVLAAPWSVPHEDGSVSAMSSVLSSADSVSAALCRPLAEQLCRRLNRVVACTGSFYTDGVLPEQLQTLTAVMERLGDIAATALEGELAG
ncbi:MAG: hypothetical protein LIO55_08565 [Oscillospiraceae bacterium]|nr:hypothetical protein [Oscillospiraceae bacterium]